MPASKKRTTKTTTKTAAKKSAAKKPTVRVRPVTRARFAPHDLDAKAQFTPELPITLMGLAMIAHEANRATCAAMGDHSQKPWHDAPQWQRDSAIAGVRGILSGEITTPEESHESWLAAKHEAGWTYGATKDETKKTHPAMVSYDKLPIPQQVKDYVFQAVVSAVWGFILHKFPKVVPFLPNGQPAPGTEGGI